MVEVQQLWALCGLELRALEASGVLGCSSPLVFKAPDHVARVLLRALLFILHLTSRSDWRVVGGLKRLADLRSLLLLTCLSA